jgi:hypothetical protein
MGDDEDFLIDSILDPGGGQDTFEGEYNRDGTRRAIGPLRARAGAFAEPAIRHTRRLLREDRALEVIGRLPAAGEEIALILDGTFHGFDLLTTCLRLALPARCIEAHLSTMSINKTHVQHLLGLGDGTLLDGPTIGRCALVVSEVFAEKDADVWLFIAQEFNRRGWRYTANRNHTKVMAMRMDNGTEIVIHGSLNLRRCHAYEQVQITRDRRLYEFFVTFIEDALVQR